MGDRPAAFAALIGRARAGEVAAGHIIALAGAGIGGALVAPLLSPNAKALLLAVALVLAGIAALLPARLPHWAARCATGKPGMALIGTTGLAIGDRTAFIAFALSTRGPHAALAVAGALGGALVVAGAAATFGHRLPARPLSIAAGMALTITGVIVGLGGLRLL